MKHRITQTLPAVVFGMMCGTQVSAQPSNFTYQGVLTESGASATGIYDFLFVIYNGPDFDYPGISALQSSEVMDVSVSNGLFSAEIPFQSWVFSGEQRWLEVQVRTNDSGNYTSLLPWTEITPAPYAVRALTVASEAIEGTFSGGVSFSNPSNSFDGSFQGNGNALSNLDLTLAAGGTFQVGGFLSAPEFYAGTGAYDVAAADFNGDGKLDLVSANAGIDELRVFYGNGSGGFAYGPSLAVGPTPFAVAVGDINGNGSPDLISANTSGSALTVWTNDGSGGFMLKSPLNVGFHPFDVIAVDVNNDSAVDLISANDFDDTLTVLLNTGSGVSFFSSNYAVVANPRSLAVADVNGDGNKDLISAHPYDNTLNVLTNDGGGGFALSSAPVPDSGPWSVAAVDVNSDGWVDLVTANIFFDTVSVLTNDATGGFMVADTLPAGTEPVSITTGDVNADGWVDLICANSVDDTLTLLTNNGTGGFAAFSVQPVGENPRSVISADLNADGWGDLVSANADGNSLSILINSLEFKGRLKTSQLVGVISPEQIAPGSITSNMLDPNIVVNRLFPGNAGSFTPIQIGDRYRDNALLAWGKVSAGGSLLADFGVTYVTNLSAGTYEVVLSDTAATIHSLVPMAIAEIDAAPTDAAAARIVSIDQNPTTANRFRVYINNGNYALVNNDFVFMVTAR